eukprot:scaffold2600_cov73-Cyclotella_meneghiniana.AAC.8
MTYPLPTYDESNLTASALQNANPIHSGYAHKLHMPAFYSFLPASIQTLLKWRCFPRRWSPNWTQRYLIVIGSYLYRFQDENGDIKGAPIPMDTLEAKLYTEDLNEEFGFGTPLDCEAVIEITSVGKTQYLALSDKEEAQLWINTMKQCRQDCITRKMGHSNVPYPSEWVALDSAAKRLREKKNRIKEKMEQMDRKEMEMQSMGGNLGGYYS